MTENEARDIRLQQIINDVKEAWVNQKEKPKKMSKSEKKLFSPKPVEQVVIHTPPEDLMPLIEAKKATREKLRAKYKKCTTCGTTNNLTVEHIIPVATLKLFGLKRMETYDYEQHKKNLTLLCENCNRKKGNTIDLSDKKIKRILMWYIKNHV